MFVYFYMCTCLYVGTVMSTNLSENKHLVVAVVAVEFVYYTDQHNCLIHFQQQHIIFARRCEGYYKFT